MSYKHILISVEPFADNQALIDKAVIIAKASQAQLSIISIDDAYNENFLHIDTDQPDSQSKQKHSESIEHSDFLQGLKEETDYPIKSILAGCGGMTDNIERAVREEGIDLIVCTHHHDFWHSLFSSAAKLMKNLNVDMLVVSVK